jgi:hypothetical protein
LAEGRFYTLPRGEDSVALAPSAGWQVLAPTTTSPEEAVPGHMQIGVVPGQVIRATSVPGFEKKEQL